MGILEAFPRRRLRMGVLKHWLIAPLFPALVGGLLYGMWVFSAPSIIDDIRLGTAGVEAKAARLTADDCKVRRFVFHTCDLDFEFKTEDGRTIKTRVELETLFQRVSGNSPLVVRYDPADPEHISTSWGLAVLTNRILTTSLFLVLIGLTFGAGSIAFAIRQVRFARAMSCIGANPVPVIANISGVEGRAWSFTFPGPGGKPGTGTTGFGKRREPFWLNLAKTQALAVADATGSHVTLLNNTLKGVSLTRQERRSLFDIRDAAQREPLKGSDVRVAVQLTLQEAAQGKQVAITVPSVDGQKQFTVNVPPGVAHGSRLRLASIGLPGANGGPPGDVLVDMYVG
jgi:hypothetical protein